MLNLLSISFPEPMCLLISTKTQSSGMMTIADFHVLVLTKRHMGSGNEIDFFVCLAILHTCGSCTRNFLFFSNSGKLDLAQRCCSTLSCSCRPTATANSMDNTLIRDLCILMRFQNKKLLQ